MKKTILFLALALGLLMGSSCSGGHDIIVPDYNYTSVLKSLSPDVLEFYDVTLSFLVTSGIQESVTITSATQLPASWQRSIQKGGDFSVTMELKPKTTAEMDDDTMYTMSYELSMKVDRLGSTPSEREVTYNETLPGAGWKDKGVLKFTDTVSPAK